MEYDRLVFKDTTRFERANNYLEKISKQHEVKKFGTEVYFFEITPSNKIYPKGKYASVHCNKLGNEFIILGTDLDAKNEILDLIYQKSKKEEDEGIINAIYDAAFEIKKWPKYKRDSCGIESDYSITEVNLDIF